MSECILPDIPNIKAHWDHPGVDPLPYLMVHMSKLRDKIEDDSKNPGYIKTVRGLGYKMERNI